MAPEPDRLVAALSALAGGAFWGAFEFSTALLSGQPVGRQETIRVLLNIAVGIGGGALVSYFLAPAISQLIPWPQLRELHALGFLIGAGAWELAPFAYRLLKARARARIREASQ